MTETLSIGIPTGLDADVHRVLNEACARDLRLATAESCTGGLLASLLTDVEGSSHAFDRGFVVYTDEAKRDLLGVPDAVLREHGAVSRAVALAMAEGALERSPADVALAVTGFAGRAKDGEEPGLVHLACSRAAGGRSTARRTTATSAAGRSGSKPCGRQWP